MEAVLDLLESFASLDFWIKYSVIFTNFFIIAAVLIARRRSGIPSENTDIKKSILIVTAHPDDEAMFFIPSIVELQRNYNLHLFCFSNGDADGLGKVREKELADCCSLLKLNSMEIFHHPNVQDGFNQSWDQSLLAKEIGERVKNMNIDAVLTFDKNGVSGHPNHKSIHNAVLNLMQREDYASLIAERGVKFFVNKDVNIVRKYLGLLDFFLCAFDDHTMINLSMVRSYKAMKAHYSQFVWYRKLFVVFSRYTYINTLKQLN